MVHLHSCTNRTDQLFLGVMPPPEQTVGCAHVTAAAGSSVCSSLRALFARTSVTPPENEPSAELHSRKFISIDEGTFLSQSRSVPTMSPETRSVEESSSNWLLLLCVVTLPPPIQVVTNKWLSLNPVYSFSRHVHGKIRCKSHLRLALS